MQGFYYCCLYVVNLNISGSAYNIIWTIVLLVNENLTLSYHCYFGELLQWALALSRLLIFNTVKRANTSWWGKGDVITVRYHIKVTICHFSGLVATVCVSLLSHLFTFVWIQPPTTSLRIILIYLSIKYKIHETKLLNVITDKAPKWENLAVWRNIAVIFTFPCTVWMIRREKVRRPVQVTTFRMRSKKPQNLSRVSQFQLMFQVVWIYWRRRNDSKLCGFRLYDTRSRRPSAEIHVFFPPFKDILFSSVTDLFILRDVYHLSTGGP